MDEKDFSLDSLNDPARKNDNDPLDEVADFSFGASGKKNDLPSEEQSETEIKHEETPAEDFVEEAKPEVEVPTDAASYDDEYDNEYDYEADAASDYSDTDYVSEAEDTEEADDIQQDDSSSVEAEPDADDEAYPKEQSDDDNSGYSEEPNIDMTPSSNNGVTDFSEPVRRKRPAGRAAASSSKKKKKKGSRVNNSIFGALILVTIILTVSLVLAITGIKIGMEYLGVGKSEDDITFNIPENATPDDICDILISNNIIENRTLFKIAMKFQHSPTLFPGDVTLHPSMGYSTIIEELSKQRDIRKTTTITFQEGITLLEAANLLEEKKVCTAQDFLFEFNKSQGYAYENLINDSADTFYKMEGFFFPDTYEFYLNDTGYNVSRTIKSNFASKYSESIQKAMSSTDMTLSEIVTLASIVQWEANSAADMPKVASVFLNRLADPDKFPKLQSDATANYLKKVVNVVGDTASKERYADIYDTYVCNGLPEGPVCNPGLDAINAVLNPEKTKYYYFCNNLKTGKSYFAETLEQHQKNLVKAGLA